MRNSSILRWTHSSKLHKTQNGGGNNGSGNTKWIHPAEHLTTGHVAYLVKFLGRADVDQPKGIEVVKQGIQKLHYGQEMKKSECSKLPKRELTISVNGVAIQDPKSKVILHQYPLHRISYCADDKGEKKFFSFIAKDTVSHSCFVFVSDKLAEEITLTIGQAFDLAYRQFMDTTGRDLENRKQRVLLQKKLAIMQHENAELRRRLQDISQISPAQVEEYCRRNLILDLLKVSSADDSPSTSTDADTGTDSVDSAKHSPSATSANSDSIDLISEFDDGLGSDGGNRNYHQRQADQLLVDTNNTDSSDSGVENNGGGVGGLTPPSTSRDPAPGVVNGNLFPSNVTASQNNYGKDLFGADPFFTEHQSVAVEVVSSPAVVQSASSPDTAPDPFGMGTFDSTTIRPADYVKHMSDSDRRIFEMQAGFSRGLTIGDDNFSLDDLDPLKN